MGLADIQADQAVVMAEPTRLLEAPAKCLHRSPLESAAYLKFHHVMTAQTIDQVSGRAFGNHLSVIDNGQAIAQALGFVHVVGGEQHRASGLLKAANDVPELAAALRIEAGGGLVQKKNFGIAHQRSSHGQALALAARKLADPGVGFLFELHLLQHFTRRTGLAIEAGKQF